MIYFVSFPLLFYFSFHYFLVGGLFFWVMNYVLFLDPNIMTLNSCSVLVTVLLDFVFIIYEICIILFFFGYV